MCDTVTSDNRNVYYGSSLPVSNNGTSSLTYNSNGYYILKNTKDSSISIIPLLSLHGDMDNFQVEYDIYGNQCCYALGFCVRQDISNAEILYRTTHGYEYVQHIINGVKTENYVQLEEFTDKWGHLTVTLVNKLFSVKLTDNTTGNIIFEKNINLPFERNANTDYGFLATWNAPNATRRHEVWIKNVKAKKLLS